MRGTRGRSSTLLRQITETRSTAAARLAKDLGITDKGVMIDFLHVHLAALRGLAIDLIFTQSPKEIERARKLFTLFFISAPHIKTREPCSRLHR